jgi:hypothetical protein
MLISKGARFLRTTGSVIAGIKVQDEQASLKIAE